MALTLLCGVVQAQITNLLFGSKEAVELYSVQEGRVLTIGVVQILDGQPIDLGGDRWNTNFTSKASLNNHLHSHIMSVAQKAITGKFGQDRDQPFLMYAQYYKMVNGPNAHYKPVFCYLAFTEFSLVKNGGSYSLPSDLSEVSMELPSDYIVYTIPKYAWAQVETVSSNGYQVRTVNSDNPQEGFDLARSLIFVPTQHAVSSDSFKTTIRVVTSQNTFQVFDEQGNLRPEKLAEVKVGLQLLASSTKTATTPSLTLQITGGETGRIYQIQSSANISGPWTDLSGSKVINLPAYRSPIDIAGDGIQKFYRAYPVNGVPIPK